MVCLGTLRRPPVRKRCRPQTPATALQNLAEFERVLDERGAGRLGEGGEKHLNTLQCYVLLRA